jgi:hypothetical protein
MRQAATQFEYGEALTVDLGLDPKTSKPKRVDGIVRGWDRTNAHVLVEFELDGSQAQNYFPLAQLI